MSIAVIPALVAGLVGTGAMSAMMQLAASMGLTRMPPMPLVIGSMMSGDKEKASRIGLMIHFVVMGTLVFGIGYAALFAAFDDASIGAGALIGLVHGVVVGAMAMPMMAAIHPRMAASAGSAGSVTVEGGQVSLSAPGVFGTRWGGMTPIGMIAGHVVFGVVMALVYTWLS